MARPRRSAIDDNLEVVDYGSDYQENPEIHRNEHGLFMDDPECSKHVSSELSFNFGAILPSRQEAEKLRIIKPAESYYDVILHNISPTARHVCMLGTGLGTIIHALNIRKQLEQKTGTANVLDAHARFADLQDVTVIDIDAAQLTRLRVPLIGLNKSKKHWQFTLHKIDTNVLDPKWISRIAKNLPPVDTLIVDVFGSAEVKPSKLVPAVSNAIMDGIKCKKFANEIRVLHNAQCKTRSKHYTKKEKEKACKLWYTSLQSFDKPDTSVHPFTRYFTSKVVATNLLCCFTFSVEKGGLVYFTPTGNKKTSPKVVDISSDEQDKSPSETNVSLRQPDIFYLHTHCQIPLTMILLHKYYRT